jgi:hypothetical protein
MAKIKEIFSGITQKQNTEFGLVMVLVCCVLAYWLKERSLIMTAIILSLLTIIVPIIFTPFAALWFGLSRVLSKFTSIVLLSLVFFLVVTPMGLVRQLLGKDSLRLKQFKKSAKSVMTNRDHIYTAADMEDTF